MSKGKFESSKARPSAARKRTGKKSIALPIVIAVAALAALGIGIAILTGCMNKVPEVIPDKVSICGVDLSGMTEEEAVAALQAGVSDQLAKDMTVDMGEDAEPIVLRASDTKVTLDCEKAAAAARRATFDEEGNCEIKTESFIQLDEDFLKSTAKQAVETYSRELQQPKVEEKTEKVETEGENGKKETKEEKQLVITLGVDQRSFTEDEFSALVHDSYAKLDFAPVMKYAEEGKADPVDVDALAEQYCVEPVDAAYDPNTFDITPDVPGYGFDVEELKAQIAEAEPGAELIVPLTEIEAEATAEKLKSSLFADVLGACDTAHTNIPARTNNLDLACKAINGTVIMPGQIFSFNNVVGQRTTAKGYKEAIAYVSGKSVPEVGGGVCQVASTIYSACLYADLEIIESHAHQFFVTYVNPGMDATIYWNSLDYQFRNNTPYPLRIDASVHDGRVWVSIKGTNTKDYTVKMSWELLSTTGWNTVEQEIKPGDPYSNGEVITTPYTGYKYVTYMSKYDLSGKLISTEQVRVSTYSARDKVIAVSGTPETESTEPTSSSSTTEPTEPTTPPTEPTTPPTEPTSPPTEPPTDPPAPPPSEDPAPDEG